MKRITKVFSTIPTKLGFRTNVEISADYEIETAIISNIGVKVTHTPSYVIYDLTELIHLFALEIDWSEVYKQSL
jgi:hypothetical protein